MKEGVEKAANSIFDKVLKEIKPSREELEQTVYKVNEITGRLKKVVPKDVEIRVVGSIVRSTHLRGESDIDIFLLFPKKYKREKITKDGLEYAKMIVKGKGERYETKYAQHPYARLYLSSLEVEADIVPAYKIDNIEEMGTAVDRSPLHAEFINAHFTDRQRDDVRLLKYLLRKQNLYGAEIMVSGLSGYLCELLIYQYGSLLKLLENAAAFKLPLLLDPKAKTSVHDFAMVKRFGSMFVVIDPVDKDRNVAAGVSLESLARFSLLARKFVSAPSAKYFSSEVTAQGREGKKLGEFIETSGLDMFAITLSVPDKSEDVVWPQLRKVSGFITHEVEKFGFRVYFSIPAIYKNKGLLVFFMPREKLKTRLLKGPSVFIEKAQREFVSAHKNANGMFLHADIMYALEKNRYETAHEAMKDIAAGRLVKSHKDIKMKGAMLLTNKVPDDYAKVIYQELLKKMQV